LAAATECDGDARVAAHLYERVWWVDRGFVSAAFALARIRLAAGDRAGALTVLDQVPETSNHHITAQVAAIRAGLHQADRPARLEDLLAVAGRLERLTLDIERQARLTVETLEAALGWHTTAGPCPTPPPGQRLLGHELTERGLRLGLEQAYRALAQLARDGDTRIALVDRANAVRPRTLL
jgi:serine/threonine-protein kinase PknG